MADYSGSGTGAELDDAADLVSSGTTANVTTSGDITTTGGDVNISAGAIVGAGGGAPTLSTNAQYAAYGSSSHGIVLAGKGSVNNWYLADNSYQNVLSNPVGTYNALLASGNLVIGTSGKGIDFSATSDASGMASELLDDYEEGAWTPTLIIGGSSVGITYGAQQGLYTKIGNKVLFTGRVTITSKGGLTGTANIGDLPFTSGSQHAVASVSWCTGLSVTSGESVNAYVSAASTSLSVTIFNSSSGTSGLDASEILDTFDIIFGGHYIV